MYMAGKALVAQSEQHIQDLNYAPEPCWEMMATLLECIYLSLPFFFDFLLSQLQSIVCARDQSGTYLFCNPSITAAQYTVWSLPTPDLNQQFSNCESRSLQWIMTQFLVACETSRAD